MKKFVIASVSLISIAGSSFLSILPGFAADGSMKGYSSESRERACASARNAVENLQLVATPRSLKIKPAEECSCERLESGDWVCQLEYEIIE